MQIVHCTRNELEGWPTHEGPPGRKSSLRELGNYLLQWIDIIIQLAIRCYASGFGSINLGFSHCITHAIGLLKNWYKGSPIKQLLTLTCNQVSSKWIRVLHYIPSTKSLGKQLFEVSRHNENWTDRRTMWLIQDTHIWVLIVKIIVLFLYDKVSLLLNFIHLGQQPKLLIHPFLRLTATLSVKLSIGDDSIQSLYKVYREGKARCILLRALVGNLPFKDVVKITRFMWSTYILFWSLSC